MIISALCPPLKYVIKIKTLLKKNIPLSSSVGESKTRLDEPTGADSMMAILEWSTWGLSVMYLSYLKQF